MSVRRAAPSVLVLFFAASAAVGMSSGPSNPPPPPGQPGVPGMSGSGSGAPTPRQEAEESYALAY